MMAPDRRIAKRQWITVAVGLATFATLALGAASGASAPAPGSAGSSSASSSGGGTSTAIITPLLGLFEFGNTIGLPLACTDAGSVLSTIGAETPASKQLSPIIVELDKECSQLSAQGDGYLKQAIVESEALSLINPVVNPLIASLASGISTVGTQYGAALGPFGPTVAGLGGTVAFFEGS